MPIYHAKLEAAKRRQLCIVIAGLTMTGIAACQQSEPNPTKGRAMNESPKDVVYFDVTLFSYLDRSIFDVYLNGKDIGVVSAFGGGGGLMTGVAVPLGQQAVTWRLGGPEGMPGNGETVKAVNQPVISRQDRKATYLGVHIYPDNTVELVPETYWPEMTQRGSDLRQEWKKKNGQ